jgi:hypothetical protein
MGALDSERPRGGVDPVEADAALAFSPAFGLSCLQHAKRHMPSGMKSQG